MVKLPEEPVELERVVIHLAAASFAHARTMYASAQHLLDEQQWPVAFSVAALGLEEAGKGAIGMTMLGMPPAVREEQRKPFTKMLTDHQAKTTFAHLALALIADEIPDDFEKLLDDAAERARLTNTLKFRGLYADYDINTDTLLVPDGVTEENARQMLATLATVLEHQTLAAEAAADPEVYLPLLRQWHREVDVTALEARFEENPRQFFADVRAFVNDDVLLPEGFLGTTITARIAGAEAETAALPEAVSGAQSE